MLIPVEVVSFAVDYARNTPLIVLRSLTGERMVTIPVGPLEASAIAIKSMDVSAEKPLTIDLSRLVMESLGGVLKRAVLFDGGDNAPSARLTVEAKSSVHVIECRPSDAIGLAMRCEAELLVHESLFDIFEHRETMSDAEMLRGNIRGVDTLAFGTYHLE